MLRPSLKGSSLKALNDHPFLTVDAISFICFGDGIPTLFSTWGTILRRTSGLEWEVASSTTNTRSATSSRIYDMRADAELGTFKIRRYHFGDESFVHPLHSVRFDPDHPYEIPIGAMMVDKSLSSSKDGKSSTRMSRSSRRLTPQYSPRGMPSTQRVRSTSFVKGTSSFRYGMASSSLRKPRSWELIPPSEGWMCEGDDEKKIGGMKPSVMKDGSSEEDPEEEVDIEEEEDSEEEEDPEEKIPASPSLPMDIDLLRIIYVSSRIWSVVLSLHS
ncbi:hypothetical protein PIB30_059422 [Stylosanthes scabra]|uniref:Uncharacterized protein n=1 Tax=Stylosanthes scabra TaxID=79078 RepID=A0ABU6RKL7_9FABA|nr:hypothetical protein [Stylosanthes scabra]